MSLTDPIGDMLARIKNSQLRNHKKVEMPSSNFKMKIADVLKNEGYINGFNVDKNENKQVLIIDLKYNSGSPVISVIERVSKPGRRVFSSAQSLPKINNGLGIDGNDSKIFKSCEEDLAKITGQKPVSTKFKKSISNFKTRKDTKAGLKVTLRKNKMYEFIDRLVNIALPRIKDFRGLSSKGFDKFGNFTFGVKEHIIFPEVNFDKVDKIRGLDITIVIKSNSKEHSLELLRKFNFPFREERSS